MNKLLSALNGEMHSSSELLLQIMNALAITPSEAMMISSGFISVQVLAYLLKNQGDH